MVSACSTYALLVLTTCPHNIVSSCNEKFKKIDKQFAADIVGNSDNDIVGPFEAVQSPFYRGQVIPMCAGWIREVNEDFDKIIKVLAREAASGDDELTIISPMANTDKIGGVVTVMLHQFRRAIGCAIIRVQAQHKLGRLHYVHATAARAVSACRADHSESSWKPPQCSMANWYLGRTPKGYSTFEPFCKGRYFNVLYEYLHFTMGSIMYPHCPLPCHYPLSSTK